MDLHSTQTVDTYLLEGLPPDQERSLRAHLAECDTCRAYYDDQVRLLRALSGRPGEPTLDEVERVVRLSLQASAAPARRVRWRWTVGTALAAAATLLLVLGGASVVWWPRPTTGSATAPRLAGQVLTTEGATVDGVQVPAGTPIYAFQELSTPEDGALVISLVRGGRARVYPGTTLTSGPQGNDVRLVSGTVWFEVGRTASPFTVTTEEATATVLGTSFLVEHRGGTTEVRVVEGEVVLAERSNTGTVTVPTAHKSRVRTGSAPSTPSTYDASADKASWQSFWKGVWSSLRSRLQRMRGRLR